jgi:FkbM family methyltransferase
MNSKVIKATRYVGHIRIIRRSLRYRLFNILKKDFAFEVNLYGYKYIGNLNNFIDRSIFFFGAHEKEQLDFSKNLIRNAQVVDCGANTGSHSLFYSAFAKNVLAIEASKIKTKELQNRISLNNINNVVLLNCGVGSSDNVSMPFYESQGDNEGVSSFVEDFSVQNSLSGNVLIRTLDSIINEQKIAKVNYIKIDVEGFDYEVLKGAENIIKRDEPVIQIEFSPRDHKKLEEFLSKYPMYEARNLIVNRPFFIFNRYRGKTIKFKPSLRSEVLLFPQKI